MKIINFKGSNFEGDCWIDEEILPEFIAFNNIAVKHTIIVKVISSGRKDSKVKGAIVTPSEMSNHMVYQAVDINLIDRITGKYYNSKLMGDGIGRDELFLQDVDRNTNLRWGQAFNNPDSVHFDTALNIKAPFVWHRKYKELHS